MLPGIVNHQFRVVRFTHLIKNINNREDRSAAAIVAHGHLGRNLLWKSLKLKRSHKDIKRNIENKSLKLPAESTMFTKELDRGTDTDEQSAVSPSVSNY